MGQSRRISGPQGHPFCAQEHGNEIGWCSGERKASREEISREWVKALNGPHPDLLHYHEIKPAPREYQGECHYLGADATLSQIGVETICEIPLASHEESKEAALAMAAPSVLERTPW